MILPRNREQIGAWWQWLVERWTRTPGYLKWAAGLLLGIITRFLLERYFPDFWAGITQIFLDPTMPIWLAVIAVIAALALERTIPPLYRRLRTRNAQSSLYLMFGVRWAIPPNVEHVQGPYCTVDTTPLRGILWSGDSSPTLWVCPTCGREFSTPEFHDIRHEVEQLLGNAQQPSA